MFQSTLLALVSLFVSAAAFVGKSGALNADVLSCIDLLGGIVTCEPIQGSQPLNDYRSYSCQILRSREVND